MEIPEMRPESILYVDATPNGTYALRILQAYRDNCNCRYIILGMDEEYIKFYDMMNELQDQRAKELDKAIGKLIK